LSHEGRRQTRTSRRSCRGAPLHQAMMQGFRPHGRAQQGRTQVMMCYRVLWEGHNSVGSEEGGGGGTVHTVLLRCCEGKRRLEFRRRCPPRHQLKCILTIPLVRARCLQVGSSENGSARQTESMSNCASRASSDDHANRATVPAAPAVTIAPTEQLCRPPAPSHGSRHHEQRRRWNHEKDTLARIPTALCLLN
jgi:hypothetical protein